jgi:L-ascorbate metabolism protein UlaG (beta-lactamase superfamily)
LSVVARTDPRSLEEPYVTSADRRFPLTRRGLLGASTAVATAAAVGADGADGAVGAVGADGAVGTSHASTAPVRRWSGDAGTSGVRLRWLGNNAWEITFDTTTILIDPWLTRFPTGTYSPGGIRDSTRLTIDPTKIDPYISRADLILVCHGHFDHMADVPYIAKKTSATVLGTESHHNMLRALRTPSTLLCTVRGGEYLQYNGYAIEVFASLHSMTGARKQVPYPGTRPGAVPAKPHTVADLVEGDTLAYQITIGERFRILALSTANFVERELTGLRPDLAIVPAGGGSLRDYAARLMRTLDHPTWVLPAHWDDFDHPLDEPAVDWGGLQLLRDAVAAASPHTTFVTLDHLETFTP